MILVFVVGYLCIAMEHKLQINKAATALLTGGVLWVLYVFVMPLSAPVVSPDSFKIFLRDNPSIQSLPLIDQCRRFITECQIIEYLGEIASTLFFLIGAMTIVELIDVHDGFSVITERIKSRNKKKLLWIITIITFFMSAVLDNMTTAIVMVTLVRKLIPNYKERWIFASMIIISANSGGAWSPIGDVTTIMLWIKGTVTTVPLISSLFVPSLTSAIVPLFFAQNMLKGDVKGNVKSLQEETHEKFIQRKQKIRLLVLGVLGLLAVPLIKYLTGLPPFVCILSVLGIIWVYTEIMYKKIRVDERFKNRVSKVLQKIDTSTILFFLGILLAVMALQGSGILSIAGKYLDENAHNVYAINIVIGLFSSIIDNVPLVAVAMGMYPLVDPAALSSTMANSAFMQFFLQDGIFWQFLAYCAGVGGSLLIIGSAAGVVVMGIEKITFNWYLKRFSLLALLGYFSGAAVYILSQLLF